MKAILDIKRQAPKEIATFTTTEMNAMHGYCLSYRKLVRAGGTPTPQEDARFMRYHAILNQTGGTHD